METMGSVGTASDSVFSSNFGRVAASLGSAAAVMAKEIEPD